MARSPAPQRAIACRVPLANSAMPRPHPVRASDLSVPVLKQAAQQDEMDSLVDQMSAMRIDMSDTNKSLSSTSWDQVVGSMRSMPRHEVPALWVRLMAKLAEAPPAAPHGIPYDEWMMVCRSQFHVLYQQAMQDAGLCGATNESPVEQCSDQMDPAVVSSIKKLASLAEAGEVVANLQDSLAGIDNLQSSLAKISDMEEHQKALFDEFNQKLYALQTRNTEINEVVESINSKQTEARQTYADILQWSRTAEVHFESIVAQIQLTDEKAMETHKQMDAVLDINRHNHASTMAHITQSFSHVTAALEDHTLSTDELKKSIETADINLRAQTTIIEAVHTSMTEAQRITTGQLMELADFNRGLPELIETDVKKAILESELKMDAGSLALIHGMLQQSLVSTSNEYDEKLSAHVGKIMASLAAENALVSKSVADIDELNRNHVNLARIVMSTNDEIQKLKGESGGTRFALPLKMLTETIVTEDIKELLMVFLTDGSNSDKPETEQASIELANVLDRIQSKFNVIGVGSDFNVEILENLANSGS